MHRRQGRDGHWLGFRVGLGRGEGATDGGVDKGGGEGEEGGGEVVEGREGGEDGGRGDRCRALVDPASRGGARRATRGDGAGEGWCREGGREAA